MNEERRKKLVAHLDHLFEVHLEEILDQIDGRNLNKTGAALISLDNTINDGQLTLEYASYIDVADYDNLLLRNIRTMKHV